MVQKRRFVRSGGRLIGTQNLLFLEMLNRNRRIILAAALFRFAAWTEQSLIGLAQISKILDEKEVIVRSELADLPIMAMLA